MISGRTGYGSIFYCKLSCKTEVNDMYWHIIRTAYALCLGKPICNSICNGDKCCFDILVGVGFFRGGRVAMLTDVNWWSQQNLYNPWNIERNICKIFLRKLYKMMSLFILVSDLYIRSQQFICQASAVCVRKERCSGYCCTGVKWRVCCLKIFSMWKILIQTERNLTEVSKRLCNLNTSFCIYLWRSLSVLPLDLTCFDT
jgi:hypothetical protein